MATDSSLRHVGNVSWNLMLVFNLTLANGPYDGVFLENHAEIHVTDAMVRIPGISAMIDCRCAGEHRLAADLQSGPGYSVKSTRIVTPITRFIPR